MPTLPQIDIKLNVNYSPHVVILGAGASAAACPRGDARGHPLPVMANLTSVLKLGTLLQRAGLAPYRGDNFEHLYDRLASSDQYNDLRVDIEARVRRYFASLQLPESATAYDLLLLSLRAKDLIATYNWDPLLLQAYARNRMMKELPRVVFLHGNVYLGYCTNHWRKGYSSQNCEVCGKPFEESPLLFPVTNKQYRNHPLLAGKWDELFRTLQHSYMLTIFGYAAPSADAAAREILLEAWNTNRTRELAEVEVVDILPRKQLYIRWRDFIVRQHWAATKRLCQTWLSRYPRRSCEALAFATLQQSPWATRQIPRFRRVDHLQDWIRPLIEEEVMLDSEGAPLKPFKAAR